MEETEKIQVSRILVTGRSRSGISSVANAIIGYDGFYVRQVECRNKKILANAIAASKMEKNETGVVFDHFGWTTSIKYQFMRSLWRSVNREHIDTIYYVIDRSIGYTDFDLAVIYLSLSLGLNVTVVINNYGKINKTQNIIAKLKFISNVEIKMFSKLENKIISYERRK